ncbi:hypothetical protein [Roseococcus pinisoli]|uniref:DUF4398 domain-containing protein n=1 Tax=Roseococcus pinisoli TaxID=2835040 RepID=A0ABS5Q896_9PROT|nr:hypothetical protein [Roseococcus pinisoli]MBS7809909.1 hypothetical protein [Roseococcus pinisoli]
MIRILVLAALLVPALAQAHSGSRFETIAQLAQADSVRELQRSRANPDQPPGVAAQRRDQAEVDAASLDDAAGQLRGALTALRTGRAGPANEFLERAETRLLTRDTSPARAGEAVSGGPIGHIARARAAILGNDRASAQREIEAALAAIDRPLRPSRQPR